MTSILLLVGIFRRIYSTGHDFPAVSVVTGRDFLAVSAVTGRGFPREHKSLPPGTRRPDFLAVSVATGRDFLAVSVATGQNFRPNFFGMREHTVATCRIFWPVNCPSIDSRILIRELYDGEIKQKGFFHSAHFFVILFGSNLPSRQLA